MRQSQGLFSRSLCLPLPSRTLLQDCRPKGQRRRQFPHWAAFGWEGQVFMCYFLNTELKCFCSF